MVKGDFGLRFASRTELLLTYIAGAASVRSRRAPPALRADIFSSRWRRRQWQPGNKVRPAPAATFQGSVMISWIDVGL